MVGYGDPNDQHYRNVDVGDGDDVLGKNSSDGKITVEVKLPEIITLGELQPGEIRCMVLRFHLGYVYQFINISLLLVSIRLLITNSGKIRIRYATYCLTIKLCAFG
ncbi:hypothetical protein EV1_038471 [Malus domestica]